MTTYQPPVLDLCSTYREHIAQLQRTYADLLDRHGFAAAVIHSGTPQKRAEADDQYWPLRAVPHFQHWLPLVAPDCLLVIRPGATPRLLWLKPTSYWEQPAAPDSTHWQDSFEIIEVTQPEEMRQFLPREGAVMLGEQRTPPPGWTAEQPLNPVGLVHDLDEARAIKSDYELACIAEANRRAAAGHLRVADAFRTGEHAEIDLHLLFLQATRQDDPETPYKNIVALGRNAATLHHVAYGRTPGRGGDESLLIDAGAAFLGYTSDVTRTYVKGSGATAAAFGELLQRVERFQQRLCAEARVGLPYPDLHEQAHRYVGETLADLGLVRLSADEIVASGVTRAFFPHGLGHSLGLQCHDVGCTAVQPSEETDWLRNQSIITPNQTFTIEPGIYFIAGKLAALRSSPQAGAVDWARVEALAALGGVRIEDDVRVLPPGGAAPVENFTRAVLP